MIDSFANEQTHQNALDGWIIQQIIKLAVSAHVISQFYVTLDSDIICMRPCGFDDLIKEHKTVNNVETCLDYENIYTKSFCLEETQRKRARYRVAAMLLGYERPCTKQCTFYGETPVVLNRESVYELKSWIEAKFQKSWYTSLISRQGWTEYALYFQYLEMTDQIDQRCILTNCNEILDLERSIWHESRFYARNRKYDEEHFFGSNSGNKGRFIAIQSWLPVHSWLPKDINHPTEFYQQFEKWM